LLLIYFNTVTHDVRLTYFCLIFGFKNIRMPPPPRKKVKQIAGQSKLNFGKSKYVSNFISCECQTCIADKLSCRIGRIGNHRPILSSLLIMLHLAPLALVDESANALQKGTCRVCGVWYPHYLALFGTFWISKTSWANKKSIPVEFR